ncbi:MAG: recombinase family protein [Planctomycetaceae bacterium]|nr:recombinase family protein [Planctomycetaceae bacterium]
MTLPLGITGEDVPGEFTRLKRPRQVMVIDVEMAVWIVRIFRWYLVEGMGFSEIARELNDDPDAPAPVKSINNMWTHNTVREHLQKPAYRGHFEYGREKSVWSSEKDYARQMERDVPLEIAQFEELRIIPDEVWYEVQRLIGLEPNNSGRIPLDGDHVKRPRLLRGLFECSEHGRQLVVGGFEGCVALCPLCQAIKAEKRPLFTHLNRRLAVKLTCEALASQFAASDALVECVIRQCQRYAQSSESADTDCVDKLRAKAEKLRSKIDFNRRDPGETEEEQLATHQLLKDLRQEHAEVRSELASHEAGLSNEITVPTVDVVIEVLSHLEQTLLEAREAEDDQQLRLARRLIEEMLIGRIRVIQLGERKKSQGWLQAHLKLNAIGLVVKRLIGVKCDEADPIMLSIDYKTSKLIDEQSDTAKRLWNDDLLHVEIAEQMGCNPPYVTKLIQHWHDKRGLPRPNNKKRRRKLENKQRKTPVYKQIANQAIELMGQGFSNLAIAKRTKASDTNVAKAIKWWHEVRGLPVPTAADRRNQKMNRAMAMLDEGMLLTDVAANLAYSPRGLKLALVKYAAENGVGVPDFHSRRGNAKSGSAANGKNSSSESQAV